MYKCIYSVCVLVRVGSVWGRDHRSISISMRLNHIDRCACKRIIKNHPERARCEGIQMKRLQGNVQ